MNQCARIYGIIKSLHDETLQSYRLMLLIPENIISSIILFFCTAASCRGIHPRSSTLERVSGWATSLFSASSSPGYENHIRASGKINDNLNQLWQVKNSSSPSLIALKISSGSSLGFTSLSIEIAQNKDSNNDQVIQNVKKRFLIHLILGG